MHWTKLYKTNFYEEQRCSQVGLFVVAFVFPKLRVINVNIPWSVPGIPTKVLSRKKKNTFLWDPTVIKKFQSVKDQNIWKSIYMRQKILEKSVNTESIKSSLVITWMVKLICHYSQDSAFITYKKTAQCWFITAAKPENLAGDISTETFVIYNTLMN